MASMLAGKEEKWRGGGSKGGRESWGVEEIIIKKHKNYFYTFLPAEASCALTLTDR